MRKTCELRLKKTAVFLTSVATLILWGWIFKEIIFWFAELFAGM